MISIIIPTLNEESVIEKTLSALKQKLTIPHEIIVSDGVSSDATVEIAKKYADQVVVYSGQKKQTIGQGRNEGARVAHGEFLVFLDADCCIENPDAFFTKAAEDFMDSSLVGVTGPLRVLPHCESFIDKIVFGANNLFIFISNNIFHKGAASGEFQMIRKDTFVKLGGYNELLPVSEDMEMFSRLSKVGRTFFDRNLSVYHTGRRAHRIGWPRLLCLWFINFTWVTLFKKSFLKEWKQVR